MVTPGDSQLVSFLDCRVCLPLPNQDSGRADQDYATGALESVWSERTGTTYDWASAEILRCPRCGTVYWYLCSFEWDNSPTPPVDDSELQRLVPSKAEELLERHLPEALTSYAACVEEQLRLMAGALAGAEVAQATERQLAYLVSFVLDRWITSERWDLVRTLLGHADLRVAHLAAEDLHYLERVDKYDTRFSVSVGAEVKRSEQEWSAAVEAVAAVETAVVADERQRLAREMSASDTPLIDRLKTAERLLEAGALSPESVPAVVATIKAGLLSTDESVRGRAEHVRAVGPAVIDNGVREAARELVAELEGAAPARAAQIQRSLGALVDGTTASDLLLAVVPWLRHRESFYEATRVLGRASRSHVSLAPVVPALTEALAQADRPQEKEALAELLCDAHEQGADISGAMSLILRLDEERRAYVPSRVEKSDDTGCEHHSEWAVGAQAPPYQRLEPRIHDLVDDWVSKGRDVSVVAPYLLGRIDDCPTVEVRTLPYQQTNDEKELDARRRDAVRAVALLTRAWVAAGSYDQLRGRLLRHPYDGIRAWALSCLVDEDEKRVAPLLPDVTEALDDSSEYVRAQAQGVLRRHPAPRPVPACDGCGGTLDFKERSSEAGEKVYTCPRCRTLFVHDGATDTRRAFFQITEDQLERVRRSRATTARLRRAVQRCPSCSSSRLVHVPPAEGVELRCEDCGEGLAVRSEGWEPTICLSEDTERVRRDVLLEAPIGTALAEAQRRLDDLGFACRRTSGAPTLECAVEEVDWIKARTWQVVLALDEEDRVRECTVTLDTERPLLACDACDGPLEFKERGSEVGEKLYSCPRCNRLFVHDEYPRNPRRAFLPITEDRPDKVRRSRENSARLRRDARRCPSCSSYEVVDIPVWEGMELRCEDCGEETFGAYGSDPEWERTVYLSEDTKRVRRDVLLEVPIGTALAQAARTLEDLGFACQRSSGQQRRLECVWEQVDWVETQVWRVTLVLDEEDRVRDCEVTFERSR